MLKLLVTFGVGYLIGQRKDEDKKDFLKRKEKELEKLELDVSEKMHENLMDQAKLKFQEIMEGELDAYEYITELQEDQNAVEDAAYQEGSEDHYDVINLYETLQNLNQSILEDEISSEDALFIVESIRTVKDKESMNDRLQDKINEAIEEDTDTDF